MASKTLKVVDEVAEAAEKQASKAVETTEEIISETLDIIDETLDTMERIPKLRLNGTTKKQQVIILTTVAVVAAAGGAVGGYFYAKRKLSLEYSELASREIAEARERYRITRKEDYKSPEEAVEALFTPEEKAKNESLIEELEYRGPEGDEPEVIGKVVATSETEEGVRAEIQLDDGAVVENVFVNSAPVESGEWDYEDEQAKRDANPDTPFVIEHDEFYNNETEYAQNSLTYFEGDDVLVDAADTPINDTDATVGDDNLTKFGHGSRDENIVYVRNDRLEVDFEIARSKGNYTVEVLGLDHVIQHGDRRPLRKFRQDTDE